MSLMNRSGKRLSELTDCMTPLPQILLNVRVAEKREIPKISGLAESIARAERRLDGIGRVLVRYSGTEALLRIMVEGDDEEKIRRMAEELATLVEKEIGKHDGERS
jgi:phosphoglucosamine mutase